MQACEYRLSFYVEAAHHMGAAYPEGHPNRRIHGHTYHGEWVVVGTPDAQGFVIEVDEAKKLLDQVVQRYDHRLLNEVPGLGDHPTTEVITQKIYQDLHELEPRTVAVELFRPSVGLRIRYPAVT